MSRTKKEAKMGHNRVTRPGNKPPTECPRCGTLRVWARINRTMGWWCEGCSDEVDPLPKDTPDPGGDNL